MNLRERATFAAKHPMRAFRHIVVANAQIRGIYVRYGEWRLEGLRDKRRLERIIPELTHSPLGCNSGAAQLKAAYDDYMAGVSPYGWPISFELACFLWSLIQGIKPQRILDLGSGFSSFVFRCYQAKANPPPEVCSVDHDPSWLDKTRAFLAARGLSEDSLVTWQEFCSCERGQFDLVMHDLGQAKFRAEALREAILSARPKGGMVILDDMQWPAYRAHVARTVQDIGPIDYYSLRAYTLDKTGRYSGLLWRGCP